MLVACPTVVTPTQLTPTPAHNQSFVQMILWTQGEEFTCIPLPILLSYIQFVLTRIQLLDLSSS